MCLAPPEGQTDGLPRQRQPLQCVLNHVAAVAGSPNPKRIRYGRRAKSCMEELEDFANGTWDYQGTRNAIR